MALSKREWIKSIFSPCEKVETFARQARKMYRPKDGAIVKNEGKEKFTISAMSLSARRYDKRLSRFVAFQQTRREGETKWGGKGRRKGRIFPLTSPHTPPFPPSAILYSSYFVREITGLFAGIARKKCSFADLGALLTPSDVLSSGFCMNIVKLAVTGVATAAR